MTLASGFGFLTESEARYLAKIRCEDAYSHRNRILAARQGASGSIANAGVSEVSHLPNAKATNGLARHQATSIKRLDIRQNR